MLVVSDSTCITTLLKAGEERLLPELFGTVSIPPAVHAELLAYHPRLPDFILLCKRAPGEAGPSGVEHLGRGEVEAIALALEQSAALLLTDDRQARIAAARLGLKCSGLLGVIVRAKQSGIIGNARDVISKIETRGGLYLSDAVKAAALNLAGE